MYIGSNICYNSASFDPSICQSEVRLFKKTTIQALTKEKQTNKQIKQKPHTSLWKALFSGYKEVLKKF